MSGKGWFTKRDVMEDLAKVSGIRARFDDKYVVVGEQPPPRMRSDDIDKEQLLRLCGGYDTGEFEEPDLSGITSMLRMVDKYDELSQKQIRPKPVDNNETDNIQLVISKLNPNVAEFVPKAFESSSTVDLKEDKVENDTKKNILLYHIGDLVTNSKDSVEKHCKGVRCDTDQVSSISNRVVNELELKQHDIKELREKLKSKIGNTSKTNCVKTKRDRNIAMATLVNLYSNPPRETPKVPLILIAPEFFQNSLKDNKNEINISYNDDSQDQKVLEVPICMDLIPLDKPIETVCADKPIKTLAHDSNHLPYDKQTTDIELSKEDRNEKLLIDKDIEASVEKVSSWFNSIENNGVKKNRVKEIPTKKHTKRPAVFLGPVTFKKKEVKSQSPSLSTSDNVISKSSLSPGPSIAFVPTQYAKDLSKNYIERARAKEMISKDIWTRLEDKLKAKDRLIRGEVVSLTSENLSIYDNEN